MRYVKSLILFLTTLTLQGCLNSVAPIFSAKEDPAILSCGSAPVVVETGKSQKVTFSYNVSEVPSLQFTLSSVPAATDVGRITQTGAFTATYEAPLESGVELLVTATATTGGMAGAVAVCKLRIPPTGGFVSDDGQTKGLIGKAHALAINQATLPADLDTYETMSTIVVPNLDIPTRAFEMGFPGIPELFEWFAIAFDGRIMIPADGTYYFKLTSDDGSNLYIDDSLLINNDGLHATQSVCGNVTLLKGEHKIGVDYYQGPRFHIALQLFWRTDGPGVCGNTEPGWDIIPGDVLDRPL